MRKIKHALEYAGVRLLSLFAAIVPLKFARALGRALGWLTFSIIRIRRQVTLANLEIAFPDKSQRELAEIARKTYQHFGMVMIEFLRAPSMPLEHIYRAFRTVKNRHILEEVHRRGKGGIFLTAHFGNWEYAGGWLGYQHYPMTVMVQEQSNARVDRLIRRCREHLGMRTIHRGTAMRSYLKALRAGEYTVMLADQDAGRDGVFVDFFGKKASVPAGPARFHLKTGAPMLLFMTFRDDDFDLHMEIEQLTVNRAEIGSNEATRAIMQAYHRRLESWIERYPHHWFWMHKKWKTRPQPRA